VTGTGRARPAATTARPTVPAAPTAPTPAAAQPRLGGLDPADRVAGQKSEDDLLDIPAFLRRQAN
jgi:cell division protein FtsZ